MSVKKGHKFPRTLAGQLTIVYTFLSCILAVLMAVLLYYILIQSLESKYDKMLGLYAYHVEKILLEEGVESLKKQLLVPDEDDLDGRDGFIRLFDADGAILAASDLRTWPELESHMMPSDYVEIGEEQYATFEYAYRKIPIRVFNKHLKKGLIIQVGYILEDNENFIAKFTLHVILVTGLIIFLSVIFGFFIAKRAVAGVKEVTKTANAISEGRLTARVLSKNQPEEIQQLAVTFNRMIDRIGFLIKELKEVGNNVAHDLRRPLTHIRGNAEVTLRGDSDIEDFKIMTQQIVENCDMMETMINAILEIAALDSGLSILKRDPVNLNDLLLDAEDLFGIVAENENQMLMVMLPEKPVFIIGDRSKLQRTVANLIDNALKFTPPDGTISIKLVIIADHVALSIKDTGPGISSDNLQKVFDPFFREDSSRSKPGNGLGLSYVKSIIEKHGGNISVNCPEKTGSTFVINLPKL